MLSAIQEEPNHESPPSESNRKPLHYKWLISRTIAVEAGDSGRVFLVSVSAGHNRRVRDIFGDTSLLGRLGTRVDQGEQGSGTVAWPL
jgi:hypothetical protein